jgi:hypothetical protein
VDVWYAFRPTKLTKEEVGWPGDGWLTIYGNKGDANVAYFIVAPRSFVAPGGHIICKEAK